MVLSDTVLVRHFPPAFSSSKIKNLLEYFGAVNCTVIESNNRKNTIAFAKFATKEVANEVLFRLHQKEILGKRLVAEFAKGDNCIVFEKPNEKDKAGKEQDTEEKLFEKYLEQLNSWTTGLDLRLPPPCHLNYHYPPPTAHVIHNISNMLTAVPKFYTQVLHLMNRMNLPSPFESTFPIQSTDVFESFITYMCDKYVIIDEQQSDASPYSTEIESELESDQENKAKNKETALKKRASRQKKFVKRLKMSKSIAQPTPSAANKTNISIDEVFDTVDKDKHDRKIELKVPTEMNVEKPKPAAIEMEISEGFGIIYPSEKPKENEDENTNDELTDDWCITADKLAANRIPERDRKMLPVFKNYQAGVPSCRLYIKNLSKNVNRGDLLYIYNKYFIKGIDEQGTMFDIRLMQEGRMKGQAFVTLQNVKQAELALNETNGYILKDKPLVVQFARSAPIK